jgi:hypothetical protein
MTLTSRFHKKKKRKEKSIIFRHAENFKTILFSKEKKIVKEIEASFEIFIMEYSGC